MCFIGFADKEPHAGINYDMLDLTEEITDLRDAGAAKYFDIDYVRALGFQEDYVYCIKTSDYSKI